MMTVVTVGLDIAKNVFQAHGADAEGNVALRKKLTRLKVVEFFAKLPACLVGIEACATAHHWARTLRDLGHTMKLIPPAHVKPYAKSQKNDAADAEAICEAVTRPTMRFSEVKSVEQQSVLALHRLRAKLIRHRTRLANTIRAHMAEFGLVAPIGRIGLERLMHIIWDEKDERLSPIVRRALGHLVNQHDQQVMQILDLDRQILISHRSSEVSKRLATIPGIGPLAASALAATIGDASVFRPAERCPHGSVSCVDSTQVGGRSASAGSPRGATPLSAACL